MLPCMALPAIAVSLVLAGHENFSVAAKITADLVRRIVDDPLPTDTILNINVPDRPGSEPFELDVTRLGFRHKSEPVIKAEDPKGEPIYWVGPAGSEQDAGLRLCFVAD